MTRTKWLATAATAAMLLATQAHAADLNCGAPTVFLGDEPNDQNPVVSVEVNYNKAEHAWQVFHHHLNGMVAARGQQYAMEDWSTGNQTKWAGSLNRNRTLYMVAQASANYKTGEGYYEEWLYNRSLGNKLVMHMGAHCTATPIPVAVPVIPVPVQPVPVYVPTPPPPPPVVQQQQAPVIVTVPIVIPPYPYPQAQAPIAAPVPVPKTEEKGS